jgi:hypothetical protein
MCDDQIDLNKAAANRDDDLQKEAEEKLMMDKTPDKKPLENPMDKVAEDLFDK